MWFKNFLDVWVFEARSHSLATFLMNIKDTSGETFLITNTLVIVSRSESRTRQFFAV